MKATTATITEKEFIEILYSEKTPKSFAALKTLRPLLVEAKESLCLSRTCIFRLYLVLSNEDIEISGHLYIPSDLIFFLKEKGYSDNFIFGRYKAIFGEENTLFTLRRRTDMIFQYSGQIARFEKW